MNELKAKPEHMPSVQDLEKKHRAQAFREFLKAVDRANNGGSVDDVCKTLLDQGYSPDAALVKLQLDQPEKSEEHIDAKIAELFPQPKQEEVK